MMLNNVFNALRYGPLKNFTVAREGAEIEEIDYPRLIMCINAGYTALYSRYKLKYKESLIRLIEDKFTYELHTDFAESNTTSVEPVRWIVDSEETPFKNNITRIHEVYTDQEVKLGVNDNTHDYPVMTPTYNSIQLPAQIVENNVSVSVIYECGPDLLDESPTLAPEVTELKLPHFMLEALVYYAASKFIENTISAEKGTKANEFLAKYEQKCQEFEKQGLITEEDVQTANIGINEWP